jgi:hypothetical protein
MDALLEQFTEDRIKSLFQLYPFPGHPVRFIQEQAPRSFAILLSIGNPQCIHDFVSLGFTDAFLPIAWEPAEEIDGWKIAPNRGIHVFDSAIQNTLQNGQPVCAAFED